jgi:hypothetical protein
MKSPTSPRTLVGSTFALLLANFALAAWPTGRMFMPSNLSIGAGVAYGVLCATYHVYATRLARERIAELTETQLESLRKPLKSSPMILGLVHIAFGTVGFAEGASSLYTAAFGRLSEVTYVVADVEWKARRANCYEHKFAKVSGLQNMLGGPCLDSGYLPGSRFNYRGRTSLLGFKENDVAITSDQPPLSPRQSRS